MTTVIIHSSKLAAATLEQLTSDFDVAPTVTDNSIRFEVSKKVDIAALRAIMPHDVNILPENFDPDAVKLVISDMDSTLINIECIDEIADMAGNPGGETLLSKLKEHKIEFSLISGGFHFFTDRLMERYGMQDTLANNLEIVDGKLTGKTLGPIINASAKADYLVKRCNQLNIEPKNVVAMGDGANDLEMLAAAGMGVAYQAKPTVQQQADCVLNVDGLDGLLTLLNIPH